jgi:hypothetical protein
VSGSLVAVNELRPHVHLGCLLQIRVAKFEDDFRVAHSKAVHVVDPPAQDKGVVVESEVLRIQEEDFPNLRPQTLEFLGGVINIGRLSGTTYDFAKIAEILYRSETLPLEDDLAFEIMNLIERMAVAEGSLLEIGRTFFGALRPSFFLILLS